MKVKPANYILNNFLNKKGYTLIEVLVVVAIIALLTGIAVTTFGNYSNSQTFIQGYNDFLNVLNTAKSRTQSQDKSISEKKCKDTEVLSGYSVSIKVPKDNKKPKPKPTDNTYSLNVVCSGKRTALNSYKDLPLPGNVQFNSSSITDVFFPVINGGAILNKDGSLTSGTITLISGSYTKSITIDGPTGRIQSQ